MQLFDAGDGAIQQVGMRLEQHTNFRGFADRAFPFEDRHHAGHYIGAADQLFLEQQLGDLPRLFLIAEGAPDKRGHAFRPRICMPQTVATTTMAPTA